MKPFGGTPWRGVLGRWRCCVMLAASLGIFACVVWPQDAEAQTRRGRQVPVPGSPATKDAPGKADDVRTSEQAEIIQADVSTRTVAVRSSFTGTEIVVFGAIENSRQSPAITMW